MAKVGITYLTYTKLGLSNNHIFNLGKHLVIQRTGNPETQQAKMRPVVDLIKHFTIVIYDYKFAHITTRES